MNRWLMLGFAVVLTVAFGGTNPLRGDGPSKPPYDWTKETSIADVTREMAKNRKGDTLDLGTGKIVLTPSVKLTQAGVDNVKLLLTFTVEEPGQTVEFHDLTKASADFLPMGAERRNIRIENSPHTERFQRKGTLTVSLWKPNQPSGGFVPPPRAPAQKEPEKKGEEAEAIAYIKKREGNVHYDRNLPGDPVTEMHFGLVKVTRDDFKALRPLQSLRILHLENIQVPDEFLTELAPLKNITTIEVQFVTDATLVNLRKAKLLHALWIAKADKGKRPTSLEEVTSFNLSYEGAIGDVGAKELLAFKNLTTLSIGGSVSDARITPVGLKQLLQLKKLTVLKIGPVILDDKLVRSLGAFQKLTVLELNADTGTPQYSALQKALPNCKLQKEPI